MLSVEGSRETHWLYTGNVSEHLPRQVLPFSFWKLKESVCGAKSPFSNLGALLVFPFSSSHYQPVTSPCFNVKHLRTIVIWNLKHTLQDFHLRFSGQCWWRRFYILAVHQQETRTSLASLLQPPAYCKKQDNGCETARAFAAFCSHSTSVYVAVQWNQLNFS